VQLTIKGKNFDVSDRLRDYAERKLGRLDRYFNHIISIDVEFADEAGGKRGNARKVEVILNAAGRMLRAEEVGSSFYASLDAVVAKLERQLRKFKTRIIDSRRGDGEADSETGFTTSSAERGGIVRIKRFSVKPMSPDEAVMQLDLLGHDFFVFRNADTDSICVAYKRHAGGYGLLVPEAEP